MAIDKLTVVLAFICFPVLFTGWLAILESYRCPNNYYACITGILSKECHKSGTLYISSFNKTMIRTNCSNGYYVFPKEEIFGAILDFNVICATGIFIFCFGIFGIIETIWVLACT